MKKSRTSLFRTLILSLVLLVTVFIIVIAWFSSLTEATASGLSVKASPGSGLEATFTPDVESSWKFEIADDTPKAYPLVTGSGVVTTTTGENPTHLIDLFLPAVNKSTGEVEKVEKVVDGETQKVWGFRRDAQAGEDFFETNVFFRSKEQLKVAITTESSVTPRSLLKKPDGTPYDSNLSEFGNFSRDYIAGAARVGIYDAADNLKFVWAPNKNYHLTAGSEFVEIKKNSASTSGSIFSNPEITFKIFDDVKYPHDKGDGKVYYMWETKTPDGKNEIYPPEEGRANPQGVMMRYDASTGHYLAALDVSSTEVVDHALYPVQVDEAKYNKGDDLTSNKQPKNYLPTVDYSGSVTQTKKSVNFELDGHNYLVEVFFEGNKNIDCGNGSGSKSWSKMPILASGDGVTKEQFFSRVDRFQVLIDYDPTASNGNGHMKVLDYAFYSTKYGGIGGGTIGTGQAGSSAFALTNEQKIVLTSPNENPKTESTFALHSSLSGITSKEVLLNYTSVTEKEADNTETTRDAYKINGQSILPGSILTVVVPGETGQYKFKCDIGDSSDHYLYYNSAENKIGLTSTPSDATLFELQNGGEHTVDGVIPMTFCRLKIVDADKYLSIDSSGVSVSSQAVDCRIFYSMAGASTQSYLIDNDSKVEQTYSYLKKGTDQTKILNVFSPSVSALPVDPTSDIVDDLRFLSDIPIVTLTKDSASDYYKGQIKVRIWVEGTDNEAKTPLVNGIFNTKLVFNGTKVSTTT